MVDKRGYLDVYHGWYLYLLVLVLILLVVVQQGNTTYHMYRGDIGPDNGRYWSICKCN